MNRLSSSMIDHCRGFLTLVQIHRTACVSRSWKNIDKVPKTLFVDMEDITHDTFEKHLDKANFKNIISFEFRDLDKQYDLEAEYDLESRLFQKVLEKSARSL